jgi:hypothetical protein
MNETSWTVCGQLIYGRNILNRIGTFFQFLLHLVCCNVLRPGVVSHVRGSGLENTEPDEGVHARGWPDLHVVGSNWGR